MKVQTTLNSTFPKVDERLRLKKALDKIEQGKITQEELQQIREETRGDIVSLQVENGLDIIGDGQLDWIDEASHILMKFPGVVRGDMIRYFNTNFLYRKPVIGKICDLNSHKFLFEGEVEDILRTGVPKEQVKFSVTGPFSLYEMSINETGVTDHVLLMNLAQLVAHQVAELFKRVGYVQIVEPAAVFRPEKSKLYRMSLDALFSYLIRECYVEDLKRLIYHIPYGDMPAEFIDWFNSTRLFRGYLGLDFVEGPRNWALLETLNEIPPIQAGLIDAKSPKLQDSFEIAFGLERLDGLGCEYALLTTGCGLEFLPWDKATIKVKQTVAVQKIWNVNSLLSMGE